MAMQHWYVRADDRVVTGDFCTDDVDAELFWWIVEWAWKWACRNFTSDPKDATWTWIQGYTNTWTWMQGYTNGGTLRLDEGMS